MYTPGRRNNWRYKIKTVNFYKGDVFATPSFQRLKAISSAVINKSFSSAAVNARKCFVYGQTWWDRIEIVIRNLYIYIYRDTFSNLVFVGATKWDSACETKAKNYQLVYTRVKNIRKNSFIQKVKLKFQTSNKGAGFISARFYNP